MENKLTKRGCVFSCNVNDNVYLRLLNISDAVELFNLVDNNREHLSEWLPWVTSNCELAKTKTFIKKSINDFSNKSGMQCGIFCNNKLIGAIGFHNFDWSNKSTSIGYWLGKDLQGQGTMSSCVKMFMKYAFTELGLNRMEIKCAEHNIKSRKIPERLEFKKEGLLREAEFVNKKYINQVLYSFLASDFKI